MDALFADLPLASARAAVALAPAVQPRASQPRARVLAARAPAVVAYSSHAPAGRGPESPVAKFLIGGLVTIVFELSGA